MLIEILLMLVISLFVSLAITGRLEDIAWEEEIDLNAGPAAIATSLVQFGGYTRVGNDQITAPREKNLKIVRIMTQDETGHVTTPSPGDLALGHRRGGDISLPQGNGKPGLLDLRPGIPLPPGETMDVLGNEGAAAGEMHSVVARVLNPNHKMPFTFAKPPPKGEICIYEMPTDANTAVTMDNPVDICGRLNAYTQGQTALPDDDDVTVYLKAIRPYVPAGQGGIFIQPPGLEIALIYPVPALSDTRLDFEKEFGGAFKMSASNPILVGSFGNATTLIPLVMEMVVVRPAGE